MDRTSKRGDGEGHAALLGDSPIAQAQLGLEHTGALAERQAAALVAAERRDQVGRPWTAHTQVQPFRKGMKVTVSSRKQAVTNTNA